MKYLIGGCVFLTIAFCGSAGMVYADEPPPPNSAATPPAASGPSAETIKKARAGGLKPEVHKGVTVFCWEDADVGSHFKTKKCVDENRLSEILAQRQAQRDAMSGGGMYGAGAK